MYQLTTDTRKQSLIEALRKTKGIVSTACASVGVARRTFYHWLETDPEFKRSAQDVQEEALDFVESKLMERIEAGAERSIIFYLKTRGRRRGFQERGSSENELLSNDAFARFGNAYTGETSRFDTLLAEPDSDSAFMIEYEEAADLAD